MKDRLQRTFRRWKKVRREKKRLFSVPTKCCHTDGLRHMSVSQLHDIFGSEQLEKEWINLETNLKDICQIEGAKTGAVNAGDRRAIYYLIRSFRPQSVLEIGTYVGASTVHIAAALRSFHREDPSIQANLTSIDIQDANDPTSGYWRQVGLAHSPQAMINGLQCSQFVRFVKEDSLRFLGQCDERYDFIFLDGDHSATTTYQEIPLALGVLDEEGVILLHDYYPNNRLLWSDANVIPGPFIAATRLRSEGASFDVLPLGRLPWGTKLNSNVTSLALLSCSRR